MERIPESIPGPNHQRDQLHGFISAGPELDLWKTASLLRRPAEKCRPASALTSKGKTASAVRLQALVDRRKPDEQRRQPASRVTDLILEREYDWIIVQLVP